MRLYCVKAEYKDGDIEVYHMLGNNNKDIHNRMDRTLKESKKYLDNFFVSYSFSEISEVDGLDFRDILKKYKLKNK